MCNLHYKENKFIPVMAHNTSGYDNHLSLREIKKKIKNCDFLHAFETCKVFSVNKFFWKNNKSQTYTGWLGILGYTGDTVLY